MTDPTPENLLSVICGWPLCGKGTIARAVSERLRIRHLDIDENIRRPIFGPPHPHPETSPELMKQDGQEMLASYKLLLLAADCFLEQRRSVILTATFSRMSYQEMLAATLGKHPHAKARIIWCYPKNDSPEEVCRRLEKRRLEGSASSVNSMERYLEVKGRFEPIELLHLQIDTSPPNTEEACVRQALAYIVQLNHQQNARDPTARWGAR